MSEVLFFFIGFLSAGLIFGYLLREKNKQHALNLEMLNESRAQMKHEFSDLAQKILEDKSARFTTQNQQNLDGLIKPLKEQIKQFEQKVHETYEKESRDRLSLAHEIKHLKELNQQVSQDAVNLAQALKGDTKMQGTWGEVILERVLAISGLVKGREYDTQVNLKNEDNKTYQPDVIVHLPDNKDIIIDSKVSLLAYERLQSSDEADKAQHLQAHLQSLRAHVKGLSSKQYQNLKGCQTLDFVLMFIPIEPALTLAMQADDTLFNDALSRNIVLVTPTTLLATLRTIQNIWRFEYQNANALTIAQKAGDLYDKFVGFVDDMQELGRRLDTTHKSYASAMNKLSEGRGNLVKRAETIKAMGAKTSKSLCEQMVVTSQQDMDEDDGAEEA